MEIADLRDELQRQEREILEYRRTLQLHKRRAQCRSQLKSSQASTAVIATTLSDLEAVTARAGFLRDQLQLTRLTPLRRWYLQLQLIRAEDVNMQSTDANDLDTALQACETTLSRSQRCYDVVYREGVRVSDTRDSLLDSAPLDVREILSFSTRSNNFICRVTCLDAGKQVLFTSTHYIENLQPQLELLLLTKESNIDTVITFIWDALKL